MTMCERKRCGHCGVHVNHSSLPRHIKKIHAETEEAKELERNAIRVREVGRTGRRRSKDGGGENRENYDMCGKPVLPRNMERHIKGVHGKRGRQKAGKGRGGDALSRIGKPGDGKEEERDVDEMLATVDEMLTTVEEEENAGGERAGGRGDTGNTGREGKETK